MKLINYQKKDDLILSIRRSDYYDESDYGKMDDLIALFDQDNNKKINKLNILYLIEKYRLYNPIENHGNILLLMLKKKIEFNRYDVLHMLYSFDISQEDSNGLSINMFTIDFNNSKELTDISSINEDDVLYRKNLKITREDIENIKERKKEKIRNIEKDYRMALMKVGFITGFFISFVLFLAFVAPNI